MGFGQSIRRVLEIWGLAPAFVCFRIVFVWVVYIGALLKVLVQQEASPAKKIMTPSENGCGPYDGPELSELPLMPGLPDDIALSCLARVPRSYHMVLKCVSKRWKSLVCSKDWWVYRQKHKLAESWIYALCRDKDTYQARCFVLDLTTSTQKSWKCIQKLPHQCLKRKGMAMETMGKKLYLLGGCSWSEDASDEVYYYDVSMNTWCEAAPMSTARCYFSCEAVDGKIFAIGGLGRETSDTRSWDTYDPHINVWESYLDPNIILDVEDSVVMDGKIYIRSCASAVPPNVSLAVYDPPNGKWLQTDADMALGWHGPAVAVDGTLYVLDQSLGTKLMMWQKDTRDWVAVCRLSPLRTRPPCQMVAIGKNIFIIGKGLSTVVLDVGNIGNTNGVVLTSSMPVYTASDYVISCKCVSF